MDHDGVALDVGHSQVRRYDVLRGLAAFIDCQHRQIALMAFAERTKVLAGVGRVVVVARWDARGWLAVRPAAGATIRIDVDMETVVARRYVKPM